MQVSKSNKLANVCYDIRGPVLKHAKRLEEEGHRILKLNIGNPAPFGFEAPEEILQDVIRNLPTAQGYSDSKGLFSARKAIMQYYQQKQVEGIGIEDILEAVVARVPPPRWTDYPAARILVFDSMYDTYRGVIAYVRVFSGSIKAGDFALLMSNNFQPLAGRLVLALVEPNFQFGFLAIRYEPRQVKVRVNGKSLDIMLGH